MPTDYVIDVPRRVIFSTTTGNSSLQEIKEHHTRLMQDPSFAPSFNQLLDLRQLEGHNATTADLMALAERNVFGAGSRRAIVVSQDVHYGLARMFEMMRQGEEEIMVFRDIAEARQWLGLENT
ncbi:MAG TPA: hypothetical protein VFJ90_04475 [Candidatus Didemnitutus sp.]|nr:hypothetical protein [Candidatus Didemnitutus sp.]